jgi:hypothetical protein
LIAGERLTTLVSLREEVFQEGVFPAIGAPSYSDLCRFTQNRGGRMAAQQQGEGTRKAFVAPKVDEHPNMTQLTLGLVLVSGQEP